MLANILHDAMCGRAAGIAILVAAAVVAIAVVGGRLASGHREGYLIAPYLDLDEPGERGSYSNAMLECPPCFR